MWLEMLKGWLDLILLLPRLLGRAWIVVFSATATYLMLTRGFLG